MSSKEDLEKFFDFDNKNGEEFSSYNYEDEIPKSQITKSFITSFMANAGQRNIVAFGLNILAIYFAIKGILYCWKLMAPSITIYWLTIIGYFVAAIISAGFAIRLAVTKVCPICHQNRALMSGEIVKNTEYGPTKSKRTTKRVRGISGESEWETEETIYQQIREECVRAIECKYCDYYEESEPYLKESWEEL